MSDIECPFCGYEQEINHDDGYGYEEDRMHQQTCNECEKVFGYNTYISFRYTPVKTECLNTDNDTHKWKLSHTYPREFSSMVCEICEEKRSLTLQEKEKYSDWLFEKTNTHPFEENKNE